LSRNRELDYRFSHAQHHDAKFIAWVSDLHCVVCNETWDAVPALMRFPRADARVALYLTARSGQARLVESILRRFANSAKSSDARPCDDLARLAHVDAAGAAVAAAARGHHSVLSVLLEAGLEANAVDERGVHVLTAAAGGCIREDEAGTCSSRKCVELLLTAGADADAVTGRLGWKPLLAAAKSGDEFIVDMLLEAGADANIAYHNGKTPLYCAAEWGRAECVRRLLRSGADPNIAAERLRTDHDRAPIGISPLDVAAANGHQTVAEVLRHASKASQKHPRSGVKCT
jgi:ankyrin repeat protein